MANESQINAKELGEFLIEAKRATWASGRKAMKLDDGGKRFIFAKGLHSYRDIYHEDDPNPFIGEEIVYKIDNGKNIPIWGMNYHGWLTEEGKNYPDQKGLVNFLREALIANENIEKPFRGPREYPNINNERTNITKGLIYFNEDMDLDGFCRNNGNIFGFQGTEEIILGTTKPHPFIDIESSTLEKHETLYRLKYHGGVI